MVIVLATVYLLWLCTTVHVVYRGPRFGLWKMPHFTFWNGKNKRSLNQRLHSEHTSLRWMEVVLHFYYCFIFLSGVFAFFFFFSFLPWGKIRFWFLHVTCWKFTSVYQKREVVPFKLLFGSSSFSVFTDELTLLFSYIIFFLFFQESCCTDKVLF